MSIYTDPDKVSDLKITLAVAERENAIFSRNSTMKTESGDLQAYADKDWVNGSLMRGKVMVEKLDSQGNVVGTVDYFDKIDKRNRFYSSAELKFQDASFGGDYAVNPIPQFTRYADIRVKGKMRGRSDVDVKNGNDLNSGFPASEGSVGMGDYYSRALHDPAQHIHMRFGVPEFNSLTQFFTSFYNDKVAMLARTGRGEGLMFTIGQVAGMVVNVLYWPLLVAHAIGAGLRFLFQKPASKFYTLKPTMPLYWNAVNTMVNQIGVYRGLYPGKMGGAGAQQIGSDQVDAEFMKSLAAGLPGIFHESGGIDVYAAALRAQRMKRLYDKTMHEIMDRSEGFEGFVKEFDKWNVTEPAVKLGIADRIKRWIATEYGEKKEKETVEQSLRVKEGGGGSNAPPGVLEYMEAMFDDGGDFATFRVNYTGEASESFSNTVVESDLASKFNSTVAQNKAAYFTMAGGNISAGVSGLVNAASDFVRGALDSFGASGLVSLAGTAFVDIPKHWENSIAQMPKSTYTIPLVTPYGNTISQMTNIIVPICMILAAALPKAAGKQAYTWPFLVELYDPGRAQTRLGIIDSVSIRRGVTNLAFNKENSFMSAEISFSVIDLSSIVSVPISAGFSLDPREGVTDDENLYSDYMNILASVKLQDQIYFWNKMKLRFNDRLRRYQMLFTPTNAAAFMRTFPGISMLDIFYKGTERD